MTIDEKLKILSACALFEGLDERALADAAGAADERDFPAKSELFPHGGEKYLGIIAAGSAKAVKPKRSGFVTMSVLGYGDVFGAATIMGGELPVTQAVAIKPVKALIFSASVFDSLMERHHGITRNYCRYLISRIRFLTERVECLAGNTAAEKLMSYFELNAESGVVHLPFGMDQLAKAVSMSRATLYRALDELEKSGMIARSGHDIRLL